MTHAADVPLIVQTVSALLYIALGTWVLTLTPRRLQTKLLGAFAIFFGTIFAITNVGEILHVIEDDSLLENAIQLVFQVLSGLAALGLAWAVPEPLEDRRPLGTALALGVVFLLVIVGIYVAVPRSYPLSFPIWLSAPLIVVGFGLFYAATFLLALRARPERDPSRGEVTQLALLGVALPMLYAFSIGSSLPEAARYLARGRPVFLVLDALSLLVMVLAAGLWGRNMVRADDETVAIHRAAMLGILGLLAAGAVYFAAFPGADPASNVMRGVVRTLGVGLLAYGVLRHDLAGLDAKVEWTVSKTTVAGIFVAVFFVVSEGAQVLFADFAQNEILGVIAAGALLFALAPIQRAADRLAERAVPSGSPADGDPDEESYRRAVETALADGEITDDEEQHLAELADELGISSARAYEIRREVEDATGDGEGS